jgi:hypothetical protein
VRRLRVRVLDTGGFGAGGIAELEVPGLEVRESLRLPTRLSALAGGLPLERNPMLVLLRRTTADFPYRAGADVGDPQAGSPFDMVDAEPGLVRDVTLPAERAFEVGGWASIDPAAPDDRIDRLAGGTGGWRFDSSGRFEGVPTRRASSAFDGDPATAWVGDALPGREPWLSFRAPREQTIRSLTLLPGPPEAGFPSRVRISAPDGVSAVAAVGPDGTVALPRPVRTRELRIAVLATRPARRPNGLRATAVGEVAVPGVGFPPRRDAERIAGRCGDISVRAAGRTAQARLAGSVADLEAGRPLRIQGCGEPLTLPRGTTSLEAPAGAVARPDHLALSSGPDAPAEQAGAVLSPGDDARGGGRENVRFEAGGPAWLVLGESYSRGWRAWCSDANGRERALGSPTPIDGFANGWPVDGRCTSARFEFEPQRVADVSYAVSGLSAVALLLLIALAPGAARRARRPVHGLPVADPVRRFGFRGAVAAALAAGVAGGLLFAVRAGVALAALALVLALAGVSVRRLVALAAAGVAAALLLYLVRPAPRLTGFSLDFPVHHMNAHWAVVLAACCLAVAGVLAAWRVRSQNAP